MPGLFRRPEASAVASYVPAPPTHSETEDARQAACPYCGIELKKVPGAATKRPDCREMMFVRTDHRIHKRLVVTEEQADVIDDGNEALAMGQLATYEQRRRDTYDRLSKKFGHVPASSDIRWAILNEDQLLHQVRRDFGLYRNTRYKMMQILQRKGKSKQALRYELEIIYIDSCDPSNLGGLNDDPRFSIEAWGSTLALRPGSLTESVGKQCVGIGITVEQAARDYEPDAEHLKSLFKMPHSWPDIWPKCL